jgi:asparagine synthase (glutamine-hydrolysing)
MRQGHPECEFKQGNQKPLFNEDSKICIVCDGEIYNYPELRDNLEKKGHSFCSGQSMEVIIHLYEDLGISGCVEQLRGSFAFAIWDEDKQSLILVRDRLGQKPLNYALQNRNLIFGSEIKSILQDLHVERKVDMESLHNYLTYQYVPTPRTMFEGIKKLPPAHILIWRDGEIKIERYWRLGYRHKIQMAEQEVCENILRLLTESIKLRLTGNGATGVFLSGGIDSSAIVAISAKLGKQPIKTFSLGFKESSFNELESARIVSRQFDTEHREFILTAEEAQKTIPKLIWHYNEPFADSSAVPTFYLAKMAMPYINTVLTGDGGDESFAGYDRYVASKLIKYYEILPHFLRNRIIKRIVDILPESTNKRDWASRLKRFTKTANLSAERRYCEWMSIFDKQQKDNLYTREMREQVGEIDSYNYILQAYEKIDARDFVDATMGVDLLTYLLDCGIVKVGVATRANSLTSRSPFIDHKLIEFAASIPANLKLKGMANKYILKRTLEKLVPRKILKARKLGFGVPIAHWLKSQMKDYAYEVLLDNRAIKRGYFKPESVKQLLDEHVCGKANHGNRIWSLINLELWHQTFIT